jgi:hypothetical protein
LGLLIQCQRLTSQTLRVAKDVPGGLALIKKLVDDIANFSAFRYELRFAGIVARSPRQQLLRLAAGGQGPDVEFRSTSGHRVGVPCYRASLSAALAGQQKVTIKLSSGRQAGLNIPESTPSELTSTCR